MPKVSSSESTNSRFNPYITKGISKNLLTPCRHVGLPRKRKTPNSDKNLNNSITSISESKQQEALDVSCPLKSSVADKKKTSSVSKCLMPDKKQNINSLEVTNLSDGIVSDEFNLNKTVDHCKLTKNPKENEKAKLEKKKKHASNVSDDFNNLNETDNYNKLTKNEKVKLDMKKNYALKVPCEQKIDGEKVLQKSKETKSLNDENLSKNQETNKKNMIVSSASKEILHKSEEKVKDVKLLKEVHNIIEKSPTSLDISPKTINSKKPDVETKQLNEGQRVNKVEHFDPIMDHTYTKQEKKNTKLKRSLSMKKPSNQEHERENSVLQINNNTANTTTRDCSVVLNHVDLNSKNEDTVLPNDMKCLQKQVQEKRKLVEDLKQAEIYKRLHDKDKLKELTTTWKNGCISALNDLLPHLQRHGDIDMAKLLNNLRVPEKLITLSENGDLI